MKRELIIHDCLLTCSPALKHVWVSQSGSQLEIIYFSGSNDCVPKCFSIHKDRLWLLFQNKHTFGLAAFEDFLRLLLFVIKSRHLIGLHPKTLRAVTLNHLLHDVESKPHMKDVFMTCSPHDRNLHRNPMNNWKKNTFTPTDSPLCTGSELSRECLE